MNRYQHSIKIYPHSAKIAAKIIKDWSKTPFEKMTHRAGLHRAGLHRAGLHSSWFDIYIGEPSYWITCQSWDNGYLCFPYALKDDVSFEDKQKLGEKLIKPYLVWKTEQDEKKEKARLKKEKRERSKAIKEFLGE